MTAIQSPALRGQGQPPSPPRIMANPPKPPMRTSARARVTGLDALMEPWGRAHGGALWMRQMVLGAGLEFCLHHPSGMVLPAELNGVAGLASSQNRVGASRVSFCYALLILSLFTGAAFFGRNIRVPLMITRHRVPASSPGCSSGHATPATHRCAPDARRRTQGVGSASAARHAGRAG